MSIMEWIEGWKVRVRVRVRLTAPTRFSKAKGPQPFPLSFPFPSLTLLNPPIFLGEARARETRAGRETRDGLCLTPGFPRAPWAGTG